MKKMFLAFMLLSLSGPFCLARGGTTKLRLADSESHGTFEAVSDLPHSSLTLSWRKESFPNANYFGSTLRKELVPSFGVDAGYALRFYGPLELAFTGFYTRYTTHYDAGMDAGVTSHAGLEASLRYYVLPYLGAVSRFLFPYIGAGYQTSRLGNANMNVPEEERFPMSVGTGGFILEGGLKVVFLRGDDSNFFLFASYKQTLPVSSETLFRSMHVGVGYSF